MENPTIEPALSRYLKILEDRIHSLEQTISAGLNKPAKEEKTVSLHLVGPSEEWIHINDATLYPELPQPTTIRGWIRNHYLDEGTHYRRLGAKGKIYLCLNAILRDWELICERKRQD